MSDETHEQAVERRRLKQADLVRVAAELQLEPELVQAVCEVEAPGGGFLQDGRPKILFEAAWFWDRLQAYGISPAPVAAKHPRICAPRWDRSLYVGGAGEWQRLAEAEAIHQRAARESASWGRFQIMGFHYKVCGFPHVDAFVEAQRRDEGAHLDAFARFLKSKGLDRPLREHRWAAFALGYNGEGYRANSYDTKIAAAYLRLKRGGR